jgi:hypothetical protein
MEDPVTDLVNSSEFPDLQTYYKDLKTRVRSFRPNMYKLHPQDEFEQNLSWMFNFYLFEMQPWKKEIVDNPNIYEEIPVLKDFPLHCRGRGTRKKKKAVDPVSGEEYEILTETEEYEGGCRYYAVCPIMRKLKPEEQDQLIGESCRVDLAESVKIFTGQIRDLNVAPHETSSILTVAQITRLFILQRRIDWELALYDLVYDEVSGFNPITGMEAKERKTNQLLKDSKDITAQISKLQSQLLATRKDKIGAIGVLGNSAQNEALSNLLGTAIRKELQSSPQKSQDIIDAEFEDDTFEVGE